MQLCCSLTKQSTETCLITAMQGHDQITLPHVACACVIFEGSSTLSVLSSDADTHQPCPERMLEAWPSAHIAQALWTARLVKGVGYMKKVLHKQCWLLVDTWEGQNLQSMRGQVCQLHCRHSGACCLDKWKLAWPSAAAALGGLQQP